jgi:hypothetical protein
MSGHIRRSDILAFLETMAAAAALQTNDQNSSVVNGLTEYLE